MPTALTSPTSPTSPYGGPESAYRLAFMDTDFLLRDDLRPVRMQLDLLKPELVQQEHGIQSTIVIFGSARILPADTPILADHCGFDVPETTTGEFALDI